MVAHCIGITPCFESSLYTTSLLRKTYISITVSWYWKRVYSRTPKDIETPWMLKTLK